MSRFIISEAHHNALKGMGSMTVPVEPYGSAAARSKKQEARSKKQEARSKKQEARSKKQEARRIKH
ncbi:hypothetical protein [Photobacterium sp. GSS17]|uniref:hypothetical protein n=1 Tax=Photobacterium sp. GSS17 TaxID=3020715 RepID=UPI0023613C26|nr:hypothetical protein [Photobacterium sp. GSS17]